jgi:hypothetical protein
MPKLSQTDRRVLLGLGGVLTVGALAPILASSAAAEDGCRRSPRDGREEFARALGGDDRTFKGAMAFVDRYGSDPKVRKQFAALVQPLLEKAQNGEDFAHEFERLGKFVSDGVPQPEDCFGIIFVGILIGLAILILLESRPVEHLIQR